MTKEDLSPEDWRLVGTLFEIAKATNQGMFPNFIHINRAVMERLNELNSMLAPPEGAHVQQPLVRDPTQPVRPKEPSVRLEDPAQPAPETKLRSVPAEPTPTPPSPPNPTLAEPQPDMFPNTDPPPRI